MGGFGWLGIHKRKRESGDTPTLIMTTIFLQCRGEREHRTCQQVFESAVSKRLYVCLCSCHNVLISHAQGQKADGLSRPDRS